MHVTPCSIFCCRTRHVICKNRCAVSSNIVIIFIVLKVQIPINGTFKILCRLLVVFLLKPTAMNERTDGQTSAINDAMVKGQRNDGDVHFHICRSKFSRTQSQCKTREEHTRLPNEITSKQHQIDNINYTNNTVSFTSN